MKAEPRNSSLAEYRQRLLVKHRVPRPLAIPFAGSAVVFRVPQVPLVERIREDLILCENAFIYCRPPLLGDVFQILWRCHPFFLSPDGTQPNRGPAGVKISFLACLRAQFERHALLAHVRRCDVDRAAVAIRARLAEDIPALLATPASGWPTTLTLAGRN